MGQNDERHLTTPTVGSSMEQAAIILGLCIAWAVMLVLKWAGRTP